VSIPIRLVTYPWFNDPRIHERERKRMGDSLHATRVIARYRHQRPLSKNTLGTHEASPPISHRIVAPHRVAKRASRWSYLSNMATTRPPISFDVYSRLEMIRERRQGEFFGKEGGPRWDSPPPSNQRTYHRGRTMLDESETYVDRRRLQVRDRASRGASRDYGGVRGGTPERVKHPAT